MKARSSLREMEAAEFNEIFDELVGSRVCAVGGWQEGRRVFFANDTITAAVFRVGVRYRPAAQFTLAVRHRCLRDFDGDVPQAPPKDPSEYPVKLRPTEVHSLDDVAWRYVPHNLGRWPRDVLPYREWSPAMVRSTLDPIGEVLAGYLPRLGEILPAERMLDRLRADGEDAWCEQRWISDLEDVVSL